MSLIGRYIATHRRGRLVRLVARKCARFLDCYENADDYAFDHNGEAFVLRAWSRFGFSCIFDVGANVGDWTRLARQAFPAAAIHCFEIMPDTAAELRRGVEGVKGVMVNDFGLADREGEVPLRYFPQVSSITTMTEYPHEFPHRTAVGRVMTGDAYVASRNVERVEMIKLDVEGAESLVLAGLSDTFAAGKVDVVQFEYGKVSILTKFLLRDFHAFFSERGYRVGKVYPDHVEFREYEFAHEDFRGSNFVAVRREREDLITAVA
ncbi:MAG: FkbM family methyltransferase [Planctomycetes bacterium]|nr:FkbM family methyltransferase [Planctomycetota bacterium]